MSTERGEEKKKMFFLLKDPVKVNVHVGLQLISRTSVFGVDEERPSELQSSSAAAAGLEKRTSQ